jgi:hypothetical protein
VSVNGRLALERPRNFKLEVEAQGVRRADIGSNMGEFWYWVANSEKEEKWIYWCDYRDLESSDLPVTYQPDWIIDAMGLKPITPQEAATLVVRRGPEAGTSLLVFPATRDRGAPYVREMVVGNSDRRIKRLQIYSEAPRVLIAESQSADYRAYPAGATGVSADERCYLAQKLRLQWKREGFVLDVALSDVTLNQFDHAMGADIFVEPDMPGYTRTNLAELSRGTRPQRGPRTRQTMPPPDSRGGIDLGRPVPTPDDDPVAPRVGRRTAAEEETDTPTSPPLSEFIGTPAPRPPNSVPYQASAAPGPPGRESTIER